MIKKINKRKHKALEEQYDHYACEFCMEIGAKEVIKEFVDADKNWIHYLNLLIKNYNDSPLKENLYMLRDEIIIDFEKWEEKLK